MAVQREHMYLTLLLDMGHGYVQSLGKIDYDNGWLRQKTPRARDGDWGDSAPVVHLLACHVDGGDSFMGTLGVQYSSVIVPVA